MLLKHIHYEKDCLGKKTSLHYLRTKEGAEVDFVVCDNGEPARLIECKYADNRPASSLVKFAGLFPDAEAIQLVYELRHEAQRRSVMIARGGDWLAELAA